MRKLTMPELNRLSLTEYQEVEKLDVIIVGAGPMGIYTAYEFMVKSPNAKVLLIDKGHDIYNRNCPILEKKIKQCE